MTARALLRILWPWRDAARYRWLRKHYDALDATNAEFVGESEALALDRFCDAREGGFCNGRDRLIEVTNFNSKAREFVRVYKR